MCLWLGQKTAQEKNKCEKCLVECRQKRVLWGHRERARPLESPGKMFSTLSPTPRIIIFTIFRKKKVCNGKSLGFGVKMNWISITNSINYWLCDLMQVT